MPCVNPRYECQPCKRGNHRWCTLEKVCMCKNAFDGEGWRENARRLESREAIKALSTTTTTGVGRHSVVRPLVGGVVRWSCTDCGFESPWWKGCERFKYCTDCERRHLEIQRRELIESEKQQGAATRNDPFEVRGEAGQGVQPPLPLPAHRDGR